MAGADKGGAADAKDTAAFTGSISREVDAGRVPIMQIHGGFEYTFEPSPFMLDRMQKAVTAGARMVVCHHSHTAQGIGLFDGVYTVHNPGNLVIDQVRLETMLGMLVRVGLNGADVKAIRTTPVYIEDFRSILARDRN